MNEKNQKSTTPPWWQRGVFYNLYVRSFKDSDGDGIGDLRGVLEKLDHLRDTLGVDVLWLSGMLQSPWHEFGFDVSDFRAIHPAMGDLKVFDDLLAQAHRRGMKVVIDYIPNHTSSLHPWFLESTSGVDNPKRGWYIWRNPKPDGTPPNNWLSLFGGPSWEYEENTWQYYMHTFLKEQPDLNWRNPQVKEAMFDVARFWLQRGVDGFRVDAAHHILKDIEFRDNPPNPNTRIITGKKLASEFQDHVYDRQQPGLHEIYQEFRAVLDEYGQGENARAAFSEVHVSGGWGEWARYYGDNLNEFHFPFNNGFISLQWEPGEVRRIVDEVEAALPEGAWPNAHTGNFDEHRVATRFGPDGARQAALLLLTMRGTPLLYYGEEIGMRNGDVPPEQWQDPFGKLVTLSRDPQRTPMQWNDRPHAGFSPPKTPRTWLPVADDYQELNVETELRDPHSMLNLYRRLIAVRKENPALISGAYQPLETGPETCFAFYRRLDDACWLTAINYSGRNQKLDLGDLPSGRIVISTQMDRAEETQPGELKLRPKEGVLVEFST